MAQKVSLIKERTGNVPALATILVGDNPASVTYVRMKGNACARVGLRSIKVELPEDTTTNQLLAKIEELNSDPAGMRDIASASCSQADRRAGLL